MFRMFVFLFLFMGILSYVQKGKKLLNINSCLFIYLILGYLLNTFLCFLCFGSYTKSGLFSLKEDIFNALFIFIWKFSLNISDYCLRHNSLSLEKELILVFLQNFLIFFIPLLQPIFFSLISLWADLTWIS